jgi:hypothetical protein
LAEALGHGDSGLEVQQLGQKPACVGAASSAGVLATVTRPMGVPADNYRIRSSLMSVVKEKNPIAAD